MSTHVKNLHIFSHAAVIFLFAMYVACTSPNPNVQGVAVGVGVVSGVMSIISFVCFFATWLDD